MSSGSDSAGGWIFLGLIAVAVWYFLIRDSDWLARAHARSHYGVPDSKIQIAGTRPRDCDFLTAPLGKKNCYYKREYIAEWFMLSNSNEPISYGTNQENPPTACSPNDIDFAHRCYRVNDLGPDEHPTRTEWHARSVELHWRKVEE